jgi:site-specific recombinase XerD
MGKLREQMIQEMTLQGYSNNSIKAYTMYVYKFAKYFNKKPTEIKESELRQFFCNLYYSNKSPFIIYFYYNALLFFFSIHNMRSIMVSIPKPKRPFIIPQVLSKDEIKHFFSVCTDLKYKTFFTLIYSSGLRLSEGLFLKISDIDFSRKLVHVTHAKGKKNVIPLLAIIPYKFYVNIFQNIIQQNIYFTTVIPTKATNPWDCGPYKKNSTIIFQKQIFKKRRIFILCAIVLQRIY